MRYEPEHFYFNFLEKRNISHEEVSIHVGYSPMTFSPVPRLAVSGM